MRGLPEFAVQRPTITITLVLLCVTWGGVSFFTMPRREDPEFTLKIAIVTTRWHGASAEQIEKLVTDPLEDAIDGLEEVRLIRSTSSSEQSVIFVELEDSVPGARVDDAWDRVRARIRNVPMPEESISPFLFDEFSDTSVLLYAVHQRPLDGDSVIDPQYAYSPRQLDLYSERIRDALRLLPGVSQVGRFGVQEEAIYLETDEGNWSTLELTTSQIESLAESQNIVAPGGKIDAKDGRFFVKPAGDVSAVAAFDSLVVGVVAAGEGAGDAGFNQVPLKNMGLNVRRGYIDPPQRICRYGTPEFETDAIILAVSMKSGANIIDICDRSKGSVAQLQRTGVLPPDLAVSIISDQSDSVKQRIREVGVNIVQAILVVVVLVYLVVGFRTAAVMAANIPFVVISSLAIITLFDVQLEQMSLASMIISLGLLVDNAVQICDQSRTNQIAGMSPREASVEGAKMLGPSMLSGTGTTIAAFIPMLIAMDGANREFIYSLPITLSVMLAVSWVLAMTFCVILAAWFIRPPKDTSRPTAPLPWLMARLGALDRQLRGKKRATTPLQQQASRGGFYQLYAGALSWSLRHRFVTISASVGMFLLATRLPVSSEFFPLTQRDQFAVEIHLPESSSIEQTNRVARQVEEMIRALSHHVDAEGQSHERLLNMRTIVGGGGSRWYLAWEPESLKPNYAEILIHTTDGKFTHDFAEQLRVAARQGIETLGLSPVAGARVVPVELALGPPADPVVLRVMGNGLADASELRRVANRVKSIVDAEPDTWDVNDSWGVPSQQLFVDVDSDRASLSGVRNAEVAATLDAYYSGKLLTMYREGDRQIPVYFRLNPESRQSPAAIKDAHIESRVGKISLAAIASVKPQWRLESIDRRNGNRTIEVRSRVNFGASGNDITNRVFSSAAMEELRAELPPGFRIEIGGALEESMKAQWKMFRSFGMSFIAIILLLIFQFNSLARTAIIIVTLPLALVGALFGLWVTGNAFGFMPQLGVLALFGIVLNSAILFVEFADIVMKGRRSGTDQPLTRSEHFAAIVDAARQRLMPIFLTTATTVGGLVPLALAGGPLWTGLAWLLIFGLSFATALTLFVIPVLYSFLSPTSRGDV
ncbi:Antibiotic efflux pump membrane transporter ArpB [Stieleria neptunia]|uniref:Antibiotic efflux pump membrane transporter ArpB n=1 Tax=Stieleria neptunia TaxID=2527979 RepID=A0A518HWD9_9BACT|nr:efflux RND transporter permease subunit [Stieleria neptunia]QDV45084.1 Antibiotic efflux pump membrane transporter ArpB [Stieleria neptunia]